jgi:hypothetical protein
LSSVAADMWRFGADFATNRRTSHF